MPNWEAYSEAYKRGILPEDKKAVFEEAMKRGLVPNAAPAEQSAQPATPQPEAPPKGLSQLAGEGSMLEYQGQMTEPSRAVAGAVAPYAPAAGAVLGGTVAAPFNIVAPVVAEVAGAGIGYLAGTQAKTLLQNYSQGEPLPSGTEMGMQAVEQYPEAATAALGGPVIGKMAGVVASSVGKLAKQSLGSLTGTGTAAIEEAIKGSPRFRDALRGKISSDEIVQGARDALGMLKQQRGAAYQAELEQLATNKTNIDIATLKQKTMDTIKQYVRVDRAGDPDWSRSALGPEKSVGVQ